MKTLIAIAAASAAFFAFGTPQAQAGPAPGSCRTLSHCNHCNKSVFAYYRPVRYVNKCAVYGWVPSYHTACHRASSGVSLRFSTGIRNPNCSTSRVYNYGYSSPTVRARNYSRSIRSYHFSRSYPTIRGRSYSRCR